MSESQTTTTTSAPSLSGVEFPFHIAFTGKAGTGKSTAAALVQRTWPDLYRGLSFATPLKEAAAILWPEPGRKELQWFGNTLRGFDPDVFLNAALAQVDRLELSGKNFVNDDTRFPNEVTVLRERGAKFIHLVCREETRVDRLQRNGKFQTYEQLFDETETALDEGYAPDWTIDTSGFDQIGENLTEAVFQAVNRLRRQV